MSGDWTGLLRRFHSPCFANYGHLDLAGILEIVFDPLGDILRQPDGAQVVHIVRLNQNPDLAAGLDGIGLRYAGERVADIFQRLDAAYVGLQRFTPRPGRPPLIASAAATITASTDVCSISWWWEAMQFTTVAGTP